MALDRCRRGAAELPVHGLPPADTNALSANISTFCALLRGDYGFTIGSADVADALCAVEIVGVCDEARVRTALRLVCCMTREQARVFDEAFDAFFRPPARATPQPTSVPRHTRPRPDTPAPRTAAQAIDTPEFAPEFGGSPTQQMAADGESDDATAWRRLWRARYSPLAATAATPQLHRRNVDALRDAARRMTRIVHRGRARSWKSADRGARLDLRRITRAGLQNGGEPLELYYREQLRRRLHFVVLVDGSRSMSDKADAIVAFSRALCDRSPSTRVFFFSTDLRDVTRDLRAAQTDGAGIAPVGPAWGGGTKIGAALRLFLARHGGRLLTPQTVVIVWSDGLDAGEVPLLERAMREIDRRSAAVVWLNPFAGATGYRPTARGMRAALPFVTIFGAAAAADEFVALARQLARTLRVRRRRY